MNSIEKMRHMAFKWVKRYLLREKVPPFWLCVIILLAFEFHLRKNMFELSIFALIAAIIAKFNVLFLIPFCPTEEHLPIAVVTIIASLLSCNRKWKLYIHLFSLSAVVFDRPDIKYGVLAASSVFLLGIIFKHLEF
jgi:hypothetical protein